MHRTWLLATGALLCYPSPLARADVNREALVRLDLAASPILRGFRPTDTPRPLSTAARDADASALAVRRQRLFQGPTEVRITAMLFATAAARDGWIARARRSYQRGLRFRDIASEQSVKPHVWMMGAADRRARAMGAEAMANRVLLMLEGFQHPEIVRRGQAGAAEGLTDAALARCLGQAGDELVKRARALPTNKP